jgi:GntR family histidine utilization transcriptional repressor
MPRQTPELTMESSAEDAPMPLYLRLKQMITRQIDTGAWPAHHRVPSENELVEQFGASRMTINRALRELTAEGRLVRMQGVGTFVAEPKMQSSLLEVNNIADEIAERGHRHRSEVILLREEPAGPERAVAMDLREGEKIFHSIIVHYQDNVPVQIEDRYVNPGLAPDYLKQDFVADTPNAYLQGLAPLTAGEHIVEAVIATADEAKLLQIPRAEPCLLIRRRTWSGKRVVTFARLLHPGSRHRLEGRFGPTA